MSELAPYATRKSRGRLHKEQEDAGRSPFQRDRDRIIHSTAFRRLEYKTQVFVNHEGDHYRTRLTHSLEVAQITRAIARQLKVDEDLAETLALAHDLGHPPFGHAGEDALNAAMKNYGGFDHNAQTIHVLTSLEDRYANFNGLNLTWETLEGIAKHNGPLDKNKLPRALKLYNDKHDLELQSWPGIEAQVAAIADDVAYNSHDIDDGIRAGLFVVDDLLVLPVIGDCFNAVLRAHPDLTRERLVHEAHRRIIHRMLADVVENSRQLIKQSGVVSAEDVRANNGAVVAFSPDMLAANKELKKFLMKKMYRHYKVNRMTSKARRVLSDLFDIFINEPQCMPPEWQRGEANSQITAEAVADYLAGMTDRFAMQEHRRLFDLSVTIQS